jgi:WD40 repeat protein
MVRVVLFQPKGDLLASSDKAGVIFIWDQQGRARGKLLGHRDLVRTMSFHSDGKLLASGSKDGTMKLWSMETFRVVAEVKNDGRAFQALAFAPDGKTLATGGGDGQVRLWETARFLDGTLK